MRKTKLGQELIAGLKEIADFQKGKAVLRVAARELPAPARRWRRRQIVKLRKERFGVSQPVFASLLSVTTSTVRAWEQGLKSPSGAARRLLELAEIDPSLFQRFVPGCREVADMAERHDDYLYGDKSEFARKH